MQSGEFETLLATHPFFSGVPFEYIVKLAVCADATTYETGDWIIREGDDASHFFLITAGHVALETHSPERGSVCVQTLGRGDIIGWSWLIPPYHWRFDARAREHTSAIRLDAARLREYCEEDHSLGYELMKRVSEVFVNRLEAARVQLLDLYGHSRSVPPGEGAW